MQLLRNNSEVQRDVMSAAAAWAGAGDAHAGFV